MLGSASDLGKATGPGTPLGSGFGEHEEAWGAEIARGREPTESMRKCGALTRPWRDGHRLYCRWLTPDTSVRTGAGASRRGSGCGSATAGARRVASTASAASWQTVC